MFLGTATTATATNVLGKSYWNVWDLYDAILDQYWGPGARAGMVFASFGMMLAVLITNAGSNSLPVGADLTGIFPRWLTIVRGQVLCAVLVPLLVPWKIIANAALFLTFLGSYTVFLMPICACMIVDYWAIRKDNFHVPSLYDNSPKSPYSYYKGWNLRMLAAWLSGVAFTIHGVARSPNPHSLPRLARTCTSSGSCYLSILPQGSERELQFEELAANEGFFDNASVGTIAGVLDGEETGGLALNTTLQRVKG
ncbi:hypothetical protein CC80DRAFT_566024 [Byssothecium circinans]|uniref:Allantoin permease n=1 Tax=Byssothecium circinans TaxID=147558 RepID=A0A6A5UHH5_9PLEO|nr:hypothetical protein CC80DRAFT_566024 [Byssothecium circinans]